MIAFDRNFFLGEEREGVYVESRMKCIWAASMEVLAEIDQICERHNLRWFAYAGTLLGAARHKGFIPWDDDVDICMLRSDYNKFIHFAQLELPAGFELLSPYTNNHWNQPFSLVRNSETINISPEHLGAFHGCPYAVGVDLFPMDALPLDSAGSVITTLYSTFLTAARQTETDLEEVLSSLSELEELTHARFDPNCNLMNQLYRASDKVCQIYDLSECEYVTQYSDHACKELPLKKEWFNETVWLPFENIMVRAPKQYEDILSVLYDDWRTPVKGEQHSVFRYQADQLQAEIITRINQGKMIF